ncbi:MULTISPECIES: hypothetical protein [unclassified Streptomyces]|nr:MULTISPECIES: hypothetical protein [unclassified Streptomyces]
MAGKHDGGTGAGQGGSRQDDSQAGSGAKHGGGGSGDGTVGRDDTKAPAK